MKLIIIKTQIDFHFIVPIRFRRYNFSGFIEFLNCEVLKIIKNHGNNKYYFPITIK